MSASEELAERKPAGVAFRRALLKLSGESLMGDREYGVDPHTVASIARPRPSTGFQDERIVQPSQMPAASAR